VSSREFVRSGKAGRQALLTLGAGLVCLTMAAVNFVNSLSSPPGATGPFLPGAVGGMAAAGALAVLMGLIQARSPSRITVEPDGLRLEGMLSTRRLRWEEIAELRREKLPQGSEPRLDVLVLLDAKGKAIARITATFDRFAELVAEIEASSSRARGVATYDRQREIERKRRGQVKERRLLAVMGGLFLCGGAFLAWTAAQEWIHEAAFRSEGVPEQARIVRRYLRNVTPRLEYSFSDRAGRSFTRDVAMDAAAWEVLEGAERVLIVYLPSDPDWSRLMLGEVSLTGTPGQSLAIGVLGLVMGAAFVTLTAKGYCGFDRRHGRLRLIRVGDVDEELERAPR
jgi:hypothetical protein